MEVLRGRAISFLSFPTKIGIFQAEWLGDIVASNVNMTEIKKSDSEDHLTEVCLPGQAGPSTTQ